MILLDQSANGAKEYFHHDEATDTTTITTVQDVSGFLDKLANKRNIVGSDAITEEFWHYASIPAVVEIELRNKGINIYNPEHRKAMFKEINSNYPYLKTTNKRHA